jgi:hypothetical protein
MKPLKTMRSNPLSELLTRPENLSISFFMNRSLLYFLKFVVIFHYTKEAAHFIRNIGLRALSPL